MLLQDAESSYDDDIFEVEEQAASGSDEEEVESEADASASGEEEVPVARAAPGASGKGVLYTLNWCNTCGICCYLLCRFCHSVCSSIVLQHVHGTFVAATGGKTVKKQEELVSSIDSESDQAESEEYQEDFEDDEEQQVAAPAVSKKNRVQSGSQNAPGRKV